MITLLVGRPWATVRRIETGVHATATRPELPTLSELSVLTALSYRVRPQGARPGVQRLLFFATGTKTGNLSLAWILESLVNSAWQSAEWCRNSYCDLTNAMNRNRNQLRGTLRFESLERRLFLAADMFEPNDSLAEAFDLGTGGQTYAGLSVHAPDDHDWYKWTAPADGGLTVDMVFKHAEGDLELDLFDAEKRPPLEFSYTGTDNERVSLPVVEGKTYYIHVFGFVGVFGGATNDDYELRIAFLPKDALEGTDGNDRIYQAFDLGTGGQTHSELTIHAAGNDDWYRWMAPTDGTLSIDVRFAHDTGDLNLELFDAGQHLLAKSATTTDDEHIEFSVTAHQTYWLHVFGVGEATHDNYQLSIGGFPVLVADAQWYGDAAAGAAGDGVSWSDPGNWAVAGVSDVVPSDAPPGVDVTFRPAPTIGTIGLGGSRTVNSAAFEAGYTLDHGTLTITTGEVTVSPEVTVAISSDLVAGTGLNKLGDGTLLIDGRAGNVRISAGTIGGSGVVDNLTVGGGGTVNPGSSNGVLSVAGEATIAGGFVAELDVAATDQLQVGGSVTLLPGSRLELDLRDAHWTAGDVARTIISGASVVGTFTAQPPINQHLGRGVFTREVGETGSAVRYDDTRVVVLLLSAAPGDANGDRRFDQLDIVRVLQGGKYLVGQDAVWTGGDWTGDGRFDQLDIVAALQTGNYLQGPYAGQATARK